MVDSIKTNNVINDQMSGSNSARGLIEKKTLQDTNTQEIPKIIDKWTDNTFYQSINKEKGKNDYTYLKEEVSNLLDLEKDSEIRTILEKHELEKLQALGFDVEKVFIEDYHSYTTHNNSESNKQEKSKVGNKVQKEKSDDAKSLKEKIERIKEERDEMYLSAFRSDKDITINSLYESSFKGEYKKSSGFFKEQDVNKILEMNGIERNESSIWATKMLLDYGIEVDVHSIQKLGDIQTAVDSLEGFAEKQKEIEEIKEEKVEERTLVKDTKRGYTDKDIENLKAELGSVTSEDIRDVVEEGDIPNIKNLKEMMYKNTKKALVKNKEILSSKGEQVHTGEIKQVKEQIDEIRSKLTVEAAQRISEKMPIESMQLSEMVKEIRAVEENKIEKALLTMELDVTEENKKIVQNVLDTKVLIANNKTQTAIIETQDSNQSESKNTLENINIALKKYEANESVPEKRFKEDIRKVDSQIKDVLENNRIEATDYNTKAAKALITNGMEVNKENIQSVISNTMKLNTFIEEMTPNIAAKLIKEGVNPYKASIDELTDYIKENNIEGLKQSVAEAIVALEDKGSITQSDKEGLIGLYRIINTVQKYEEEVAGYLYKNNLPLTVKNLEDATRYIDSLGGKHHISTKIDDSFGENTSEVPKESAKAKLEMSSAETTKKREVVELIANMPINLGEDTKSRLNNITAYLYPFIKEQFKGQMGKFEGMSTLPDSFLEKLEYIKSIDPEVINTMTKSNISLTVSNMYWFDKMNKDPELYSKLLDNKLIESKKLPDSIEEIEETLDILEQKAMKDKEISVNTGDISSYKQNKFLQEMTQVHKQLIKEECIYQIPFIVNGEQRLINLSLDKKGRLGANKKDELKAIIGYETESLGKIKAYLTISETEISYKIEAGNEKARAALDINKDTLDRLVKEIGYSICGDARFEARSHNIEETSDKDKSLRSGNVNNNETNTDIISKEGQLVSQIKDNHMFFEEVI